MIICGIKFSHDGAVALIDDGKLIFSIEMEKLNNNKRYSEIDDFSRVEEILNLNGYNMGEVDQFVVDGWGDKKVNVNKGTLALKLDVANYGFTVNSEDILKVNAFENKELKFDYRSYLHVSGHVMGAYCTSPFAKRKENSYVLVWDGSMPPQLFLYNYDSNKVENCGPLFWLNGSSYALMGLQFPPFKDSGMADVHAAGKIMAYIAKGTVNDNLLQSMDYIYENKRDKKGVKTDEFVKLLAEYAYNEGYTPEDIMATFHVFLEQMIIKSLSKIVDLDKKVNICLGGGCALNIKWNSAIRSSGIFEEVWVSPFPNDSGNAIGAACCEMVISTPIKELDWNVYTGPAVIDEQLDAQWSSINCDSKLLAKILHESNEPVVVLNGRAELGPRALGSRSILAAAVSPKMKDVLNNIKNREPYRPVAPICLEEDAPNLFEPGTPDPYMLFDHKVKNDWMKIIPAICHLDGSARLQTINKANNSFIYELLCEYKELSGVPVLCNTSANYNGSGFFPDVNSVISWNKVNFIWCEGQLYHRKEQVNFLNNFLEGSSTNGIGKMEGFEI